MQFDRIQLGRQAKKLGFVRDTFEKVCRLVEVLSFMEKDSLISTTLALKGGTAINLMIFDLPRLSVDIDLDFSKDVTREEMLAEREIITERINKYMTASGYFLSPKSKKYHALDSFVYEYQNAGGGKDNLKIEINYMLRCHMLPIVRRKVRLDWLESELKVLSVAPIEIFSSKIVALLNRTAPRDLYDVYNMLKYGLFDESEQAMLRKGIVLYRAIASDKIPKEFELSNIGMVSQYRIKTELLPVLHNKEYFEVKDAQEKIIEYLSKLLILDENEIGFLNVFRNNEYCPELLFGQSDETKRLVNHPMARWKCQQEKEKM